MPNRNEFGAFAVGLLVGSLGAGVAALLLAPQSGEETRTLIKEKSIELRDRAEELASEARVRADELTHQLMRQSHREVEAVGSPAVEKPNGKIAV